MAIALSGLRRENPATAGVGDEAPDANGRTMERNRRPKTSSVESYDAMTQELRMCHWNLTNTRSARADVSEHLKVVGINGIMLLTSSARPVLSPKIVLGMKQLFVIPSFLACDKICNAHKLVYVCDERFCCRSALKCYVVGRCVHANELFLAVSCLLEKLNFSEKTSSIKCKSTHFSSNITLLCYGLCNVRQWEFTSDQRLHLCFVLQLITAVLFENYDTPKSAVCTYRK